MTDILWESIYGARTRSGLVVLRVDGKEVAQMTPEEARSQAADAITVAAAAEMDEVWVTWLMTTMDLSLEAASAALGDLRRLRAERREAAPTVEKWDG